MVGAGLLAAYLFGGSGSAAAGGDTLDAGIGATGSGWTDQDYGSLFGGTDTGLGANVPSSIWSNPQVVSSGILAGTSLLGGLFGGSAEEDAKQLSEAQLAEQQRQFDAKLELEKAQMAQALQIAQINAGAARAGAGSAAASANIARDTALRQARANAIGQATEMKTQALQLPAAARLNQSNAAQNTGAQSGLFFNSLIPNLQRPALRG